MYAESRGIPVYQPATLKTGEAAEIIRGIAPDIIVVVAYGKILPPEILNIPRYGCINGHASLLPKYRGRLAYTVVHSLRRKGNRRYGYANGRGNGHGRYS